MDIHLQVFKRVTENDVQAYEMLFNEYYHFLCSFAYGHVKERHTAEEIVEDFFVDFWNNRHKLVITTSVRSYFITAVHNRCLNYIQREKSKFISAHDISNLIDNEGVVGDKLITIQAPSLLTKELEGILKKAIDNLPENCKKVFLLSRARDLSYDEIATKLNVSVNTVKTQMKIALSKLRDDLKEYLTVLLIFIFH